MNISSDTVIVLTGASSGVGKAIALTLAPLRPRLILAARRTEALEDVANECTALGAAAEVVQTDTRIAAQVERLAQRAAAHSGRIDVWINNAGMLAAGALQDVPAEVNEAVIGTNVLGYINGAQQALRYFKRQGRGILINNISIGGWLPTPYATAYSASKYALRGFSEALKGELLADPEIHVVDLYPGFLDTPGMQHAANYTGKVLKPTPPVGDPFVVAKEVVKLIGEPQPQKTIGLPSALLQLSYKLFPLLTRNITARVIQQYLGHAASIAHTSGNTLEAVPFGTGVEGGWRKKNRAGIISLGLVAFSVAGFVLSRRKLNAQR